MRFIEIYRKLEQENEGYMILIRSGIFFIGVGRTAKILAIKILVKFSNIFVLQKNKMEREVVMNLCFFKGKVIEEVKFNFFYRRKQTSIAKTKIKLENGSIILIKGYDEMADWMYHYIEMDDSLLIQGKIGSYMEVKIDWIKKVEK